MANLQKFSIINLTKTIQHSHSFAHTDAHERWLSTATHTHTTTTTERNERNDQTIALKTCIKPYYKNPIECNRRREAARAYGTHAATAQWHGYCITSIIRFDVFIVFVLNAMHCIACAIYFRKMLLLLAVCWLGLHSASAFVFVCMLCVFVAQHETKTDRRKYEKIMEITNEQKNTHEF